VEEKKGNKTIPSYLLGLLCELLQIRLTKERLIRENHTIFKKTNINCIPAYIWDNHHDE
jgi:hypothetical protein